MNTYVSNNDEKSITLSAKDNEELIMASNLFERKQNETNEKAEQIECHKSLRKLFLPSKPKDLRQYFMERLPILIVGGIILLSLLTLVIIMSWYE